MPLSGSKCVGCGVLKGRASGGGVYLMLLSALSMGNKVNLGTFSLLGFLQ